MTDPTVAEIQMAVCAYYNVAMIEMRSARRARAVARPRQVAMYLAREFTSLSLPAIGRLFDRDHTTVLHAVRTIDAMCRDGRMQTEVDELRAQLCGCDVAEWRWALSDGRADAADAEAWRSALTPGVRSGK